MGRIVKGFGQVVPGEMLDARAEAAAILASARAEAERLRTAAEKARVAAERGGFEAGQAAGIAELAGLIGAARAEAERERAEARPVALTLALKMAERIVGRAVELAPEVMAEIVGAALEASRVGGNTVKIHVHPDELPVVEARREALVARAPGASALAIVSDAAVARYGCVIETAHGRVDARLETQLAALERALTGGVRD